MCSWPELTAGLCLREEIQVETVGLTLLVDLHIQHVIKAKGKTKEFTAKLVGLLCFTSAQRCFEPSPLTWRTIKKARAHMNKYLFNATCMGVSTHNCTSAVKCWCRGAEDLR